MRAPVPRRRGCRDRCARPAPAWRAPVAAAPLRRTRASESFGGSGRSDPAATAEAASASSSSTRAPSRARRTAASRSSRRVELGLQVEQPAIRVTPVEHGRGHARPARPRARPERSRSSRQRASSASRWVRSSSDAMGTREPDGGAARERPDTPRRPSSSERIASASGVMSSGLARNRASADSRMRARRPSSAGEPPAAIGKARGGRRRDVGPGVSGPKSDSAVRGRDRTVHDSSERDLATSRGPAPTQKAAPRARRSTGAMTSTPTPAAGRPPPLVLRRDMEIADVRAEHIATARENVVAEGRAAGVDAHRNGARRASRRAEARVAPSLEMRGLDAAGNQVARCIARERHGSARSGMERLVGGELAGSEPARRHAHRTIEDAGGAHGIVDEHRERRVGGHDHGSGRTRSVTCICGAHAQSGFAQALRPRFGAHLDARIGVAEERSSRPGGSQP